MEPPPSEPVPEDGVIGLLELGPFDAVPGGDPSMDDDPNGPSDSRLTGGCSATGGTDQSGWGLASSWGWRCCADDAEANPLKRTHRAPRT